MNRYTPAEYTALLNRTFLPRFPRDNRPRLICDVNEKGEETLEFILPHPTDGRFSASLLAVCSGGFVSSCTLHFGQALVAVDLNPEEALDAVTEVIEDRIVAVIRYKNAEAYENHRKISRSPSQWLYQLPDHEEALSDMIEKLRSPASLFDQISGKYVGVFEFYRWSESWVQKR